MKPFFILLGVYIIIISVLAMIDSIDWFWGTLYGAGIGLIFWGVMEK